ncbi:MAG: nucleoside phosphorylase [Salinigranum sp.]
MPLPNYGEKYDARAIVTPEQLISDAESADAPLYAEAPEGVLVCYQSHFFDRALDAHGTERLDGDSDLFEYELHRFTDLETDADLGIVGRFGIGAPTTALVMEVLRAEGTEAFLSVGWAGCLQPDVPQSAFVVCEEAIRDEGVSHHYLPDAERVAASGSLLEALERAVVAAGGDARVGPTWTTDALFRETIPEVEHYADLGVLTVDMEAAATFAVAEYRDVDAGALFLVSDYLTTDDWTPAFGESLGVDDALPVALDALASAVE